VSTTSSDGDPVIGAVRSTPWIALARSVNQVVKASPALIICSNARPVIVAFERHDHEVTLRGRPQERPLVDAGPSSGMLVCRRARSVAESPRGMQPTWKADRTEFASARAATCLTCDLTVT
jgi:hypothetical protein